MIRWRRNITVRKTLAVIFGCAWLTTFLRLRAAQQSHPMPLSIAQTLLGLCHAPGHDHSLWSLFSARPPFQEHFSNTELINST